MQRIANAAIIFVLGAIVVGLLLIIGWVYQFHTDQAIKIAEDAGFTSVESIDPKITDQPSLVGCPFHDRVRRLRADDKTGRRVTLLVCDDLVLPAKIIVQ